MKILVIYHGDNCIDGWTSAWLATVAAIQAGYEAPELYPLAYTEGEEHTLYQHIADRYNKEHKLYDIIYILDISLSLIALENVVRITNAKIICLDHHKTAFDRYVPDVARTPKERANVSLHNGRVDIALNNGMSGAGMTHMYFFPSTDTPLLVQHVQDRDIWEFSMEHTKAIDRYLRTIEQTIENWTDVNAMMCHGVGYREIVREGQEILDVYEARVKAIAKMAEWITLAGTTGLMVRCNYEYASDVGHILCKRSSTFGLSYITMSPNILRVSIRSEGDFDVEVIAKKFGGGGHKNAAGFLIAEDKFFSGELA